jgi:hypothetical protein
MNGFAKTAATAWLVLRGFSYRTAGEYLRAGRATGNPDAARVMSLLPLHKELDKLFEDLLTTHHVLWELRTYLPRIFGVAAKQDGKPVIRALFDPERRVLTPDDVMALAGQNGAVAIRPGKHELDSRERVLRAHGEGFVLDGQALDSAAVAEKLGKLPTDTLITEYIPGNEILHVALVCGEGGEHQVAQVYAADHSAKKDSRALFSGLVRAVTEEEAAGAVALAQKIAGRFAEAPYLGVAVIPTEDGMRLWQVDMGRDLVWLKDRSGAVDKMLREQKAARKAEGGALKRIGKYFFALRAKRHGFLDYMYRNWLRGLKDDNRLTFTTPQEKRRAHRHGFYSYRIRQYGITEKNYRDFLSDYEYKRLRPLNGKYQKWLWDKISTYYVMEPFRDCFPAYYFRVEPEEGGNRIYAFDGEGNKADDILACLREKGKMAAKPAIGSHGSGFYPLSWDQETDRPCIDGQPCSAEEFQRFIAGLDRSYLLSEFVEMHDDLKRIYDKVACSIRVMVIDQGRGPEVQHAYFRIGSGGTGNTDNLATGGIVARVNVDTGEFYGAEMLMEHEFRPCDVHPDTGTPLTGTLPHWEQVRRDVCRVMAYLTPMEYLGFDIVITGDGFRILEINTHQDLHRYPEYPQEVKDYFRRKCELKGRPKHI